MQDVAPAKEKEPLEHSKQPAAFTVPGFVTLPAKPGAQIVHAEIDVLPVVELVVKVPYGQLLHDPLADAEYAPALHVMHDV